jgi:hypothetical protein
VPQIQHLLRQSAALLSSALWSMCDRLAPFFRAWYFSEPRRMFSDETVQRDSARGREDDDTDDPQ